MTTKAIGYIRCSTAEQGDSGLGLRAQEARIRAAAKARGWKLVGIEQDVASGRTRNGRQGLERALEAVREHEKGATVLLAAKLDRVARSSQDFANIAAEGRRHGFELGFADGDFDLTTANGRLMADLLVRLAQWESEIAAERTREAMRVAREEGRWTPPKPQTNAETLALMRELKEAGKGYSAIAAILNAEGIRRPRGGIWDGGTVSRILRFGVQRSRSSEAQ